ncbi:MAG: NAD kinase [Chitinophagaceae bacterium]|jgi:NAD+ kinase|nr:NAD kinase [Chitinophagaceae bacterium]
MKVAIYSRGIETDHEVHFKSLLQELYLHKSRIVVYSSLANQHQATLSRYHYEIFSNSDDLDGSVDCVISLGGDGTMLDCAILIRDKGIPLLGINFGRLGFLSTLGKEEIKRVVEALTSRSYHTDQRTLVHVDADIPLFADGPFALNEFVLHKRDFSSMIKVHTYLNGEFLNTYWADGVIVSTPTGSTGYNLSCNGPIVFPESQSLVITPIAPHNLNVRSIIVPDHNVISFEVEGRAENFMCAMDARREIVNMGVQVAIRKENFTIGLVRLNENTFLETLRNKLTWGLDKRN